MIEHLKAALIAALSKQAYLALLTIPGFGFVFGLPVVSNVTQFITEKIVSFLVQKTAIGFSVLWIMIEMQYDVHNSEDARRKLKDMFDNPEKYTQEQMKEIEEHFDETTIDLIQLTLKRL